MGNEQSINKRDLSERDICTKYITPALIDAGWDHINQMLEEVSFTDGRIVVQGKTVKRGKTKRADFILYFKPNLPLAIIEAKDNKHSVSDGMQQALNYSEILHVPFAFSSNGDAFSFHDRSSLGCENQRQGHYCCPNKIISPGNVVDGANALFRSAYVAV